jgi:ATP-dependent helicase HrpB
LTEARNALRALNAITDEGQITAHGRALSAVPLPPHLAHMLLYAAANGQEQRGAKLAMVIQERGLGGGGNDLEQRLERFAHDRSGRAEAAHKASARLAALASEIAASTKAADISAPKRAAGTLSVGELSAGAMVATAFRDRVAKCRDSNGENWLSAMGRGLRLDPASPLTNARWLAVAELQGNAAGARILSAAALNEADIDTLFADQIIQVNELSYDQEADRVVAKSKRKLGAITLSEGNATDIDPGAVRAALVGAVRKNGIAILPFGDAATRLRQRAAFTGITALDDAELQSDIGNWLPIAIGSNTRLRDIPAAALHSALLALLDWDAQQKIERIAPPRFQSPAGTAHDIDYAAEAGPTVELRVQALFGLDVHPVVGVQRVPLVLSLTSPAGRPIQTTRDLPAFWRGSWSDVAKEMRGRYPKHNWPDAPWEAHASLKTKKAQARGA